MKAGCSRRAASWSPAGAVIAGAMLARGAVEPVIVAIAVIIAVPGFVGLLVPALGREATGEA